MSPEIIAWLLNYGMPGLAILGLWYELQSQKQLNAKERELWAKERATWNIERKEERKTLVEVINKSTEVLAKLQIMDRMPK